ncbi:ABC transporter permease [Ruania rhizosphaerae]|uniref:ABC transporter permease n=1 Tax=Ruania rhizosphaerae TaxID=1840413 RepID=UPI00135BBB8D|nr:ABC transporter permease [Ruania rhizosphaerae]
MATALAAPARSPLRLRMPRLSTSRVTFAVAVVWLAIVAAAALIPGLLGPGDPAALDPSQVLTAPGEQALLGTDHYGRSVLTLLVHGARTALVIGLAATALGLVLGGWFGLLAGYLGGWVDMLVGRVVDMLMCFPGVLLALVIASGLGASTTNLIIAVGISAAPGFARVMRGQVLSVRSRLYVEAARSMGFGSGRIIVCHVLPNALAPSAVLATVTVGTSIVAAASLSFLGLGVRSDVPDWGQLLSMGQPYLASAWWISTFPGVVLTLTVIAVSLVGDWLRDRMDSD